MSVKGIENAGKGSVSAQKAFGASSGDFLRKLEDVFSRGAAGLDSLFQAAGQEYGIPPALLKAVARVESGLNPRAVSRAGALGIMQLMPATVRSLGVTDPFDPAQSIFGAARYLRSLFDRFGGDVGSALAAYNAGPGAVQRWGGVPPYRETQEYIKRVLACMKDDAGKDQAVSSVDVTDARADNNGLQSLPDLMKIWANALLIEAALEIESSDGRDDIA